MSQKYSGFFLWACLILTSSSASAAGPTEMAYQGTLTEHGSAVNGTRGLVFKVYDAATGGNLLYTSSSQSVQVRDGRFTATIDLSGVPVATKSQLFLEVIVEGTTLSPRDPLAAVPTAVNARSLTGTTNIIPESGNAGIGTTAPSQKLEVVGKIKITGNGNGLVFPDGTTQTTAGGGGGGGGNFVLSGELVEAFSPGFAERRDANLPTVWVVNFTDVPGGTLRLTGRTRLHQNGSCGTEVSAQVRLTIDGTPIATSDPNGSTNLVNFDTGRVAYTKPAGLAVVSLQYKGQGSSQSNLGCFHNCTNTNNSCTTNADCNGTCRLKCSNTGGLCTTNTDCNGRCLPLGNCSLSGYGCSSDADCANLICSGSSCTPSGGTGPASIKPKFGPLGGGCSTDADCQTCINYSGLVCTNNNSSSCSSDSDCSGTCQTPGACSNTSASCFADADCGGICVGRCKDNSSSCAADNDCARCNSDYATFEGMTAVFQ